MRRTTTLALAGLFSAALLSTGCQMDRDSDTGTRDTGTSSRTTTSRTTSSSGYGADDKDASAKDSSTKDSSAAKDASAEKDSSARDASDSDATTAAQSDAGRGDRGQGRGGRGAHANIAPSKAPGQDAVKGTVRFTPAEKGVRVRAEITGLEPNGKHGFHIHEKGDLSAPDLTSAGSHFNPGMHKHGGPEASERHAGDLGNLEADDKGKAVYDKTIEGLTLDDSKTGIIGKSVIVHAKADDLKTDPSGDSGARIGGGVIERGGGRGDGNREGGRGESRGQQRGERPRSEQGGQ